MEEQPTTDVLNLLRMIVETHIDASLIYDERRFTLLLSYLIGITAVFGFWFNVKDKALRIALFYPLTFFTVVSTFFAAYLIFVYSRDSHTYFMYAEKMWRQYYGTAVLGERFDRDFFRRMWERVSQQFQEANAFNVFLLWDLPIISYSAALMVAAFCAKRADEMSNASNLSKES
jgi:hypothetical protein